MDAPAANITRVSLQNLLRSVPTFQGGFQNITLDCKALIFINKNSLDLSRINLELYTYKTDKDFMLLLHDKIVGSSPPGTLPPSVCACEVFVNVATKTKAMYK